MQSGPQTKATLTDPQAPKSATSVSPARAHTRSVSAPVLINWPVLNPMSVAASAFASHNTDATG